MAKIFEFSGGSYIDKVSGAVGVNTNGEFARTEKGLMWRGNGTTTSVVYPAGKSPELGTGDFSIELYFKAKSKTSNQYWLFKSSVGTGIGYSVMLHPGNVALMLNMQDAGGSSGYGLIPLGNIETGQIYHIIMTADRDGLAIGYLNGVNITTTGGRDISARNGSLTNVSSPLYFGSTSFGRINGDLGTTRIYDHILTEKQRSKLYNEFLNSHPVTRTIR